MGLRSATTASSSPTPGQIASNLHKECPEKGNASSIPTGCNCQLAEVEKARPSNYRGCRHAKKEMLKRKSQKTPNTTTGRVFSSKLAIPGVSFTAALRGTQNNSSGLRHARWQWQVQP
jgi:hypothetical protein